MARKPDTPCNNCGQLLYRGTGSLPTPTCRTCRGNGHALVTHGRKPTGARWRRLQEQVWATETHCGFCDEYVDQALPHNDTMARCVDHIVPIANGGAMYDRDNVRLAHRSCNSKAGHAMGGAERLELARAALWLSLRL